MKSKRGFTLVEIIAVIGILVVVGSIFTINMIKSLNKSNEEEKTNINTQIISAALSYATVNKEQVSDLYNGYAYVDIPVGKLKSAGLLSESIQDPETGEEIPDSDVVRIYLTNGELSAEYPPKDSNEPYTIKVEDLYVEYKADYEGEWCNSTNEFEGIGNSWGIYNVNSRSYMDNTGNNVSVTSCNVNPKVAGTYSIEYEYYFPKESSDSKRTITRNVYVGASKDDIKSFTFAINNGKKIAINNSLVPIEITETKRNNNNTTINAFIKYEDDNYSVITKNEDTDTETTLGYTIQNFDVTSNSNGSKNATLIRNVQNSDGSIPTNSTAEYTITNLLRDVTPCEENEEKNCYVTEEDPKNYVKYGNKAFRVYYKNANSGIKLILDDAYGDKSVYGQIGSCIADCCNQGRWAYLSLGDNSGGSNKTFKYFSEKTVDKILENFSNELYISSDLNNRMINQMLKTQYNLTASGTRSNNNTTNYSSSNVIRSWPISTKIGLLSKDEYKAIIGCSSYAYSETSCDNNSNYLVKGKDDFWLLENSSAQFGIGTYNYGTNYAQVTNYSVISGKIEETISMASSQGTTEIDIINKLAIRPTIQLKYGATITGGSGTSDDPYTVE